MSRFENIKNKQIIVYRHRRLDNYEVFYVGIASTLYRPYNKTSRNKFWKNIVSKTNYNVEIIATVEDWKTACELEEFLIQEYGRRDLKTGTLVNMTDGGDGLNNYKFDRNTVQRIREKNLGRKHSLQQNIEKSIRQQGQGGIKVIDTKTQIIYNSIVIASKELGISKSTLRRYLINNSNKTTLKFLENG